MTATTTTEARAEMSTPDLTATPYGLDQPGID